VKLAILSICLLGILGCTAEVASAQTQFSAILVCGGTEGGPATKKTLDLGPDGQLLLINQQICTWENFTIGGVEVKESRMTGIGIIGENKKVSGAAGHDWGTLANGDHYYAEWQETALNSGNGISDYGTWRIVSGTGTLRHLNGTAVYICPVPSPANVAMPVVQFAFAAAVVKCSMMGQLDLGSPVSTVKHAPPTVKNPPH
jgi:hypothetical protein